ncbi:class II fructose-bisphosphate aldolase [Flexithrix dorotheae]|uniref:class II fructose-bisphosphate aldolase n=1 Tax=Flexithrix dorotheae TaxID=70993 RepID=UPI00037D73C1|nr:class II fructose-bisphosphate aldolase [Flexithrix dorotheae]
MNLQDKLRECQENQEALLACNFYNYETLRSILTAARETEMPVILQLTKSSIDYMGMSVAVEMARTGLKQFQVEGWIHLDHGGSIELVEECLKAGFDSVMIDASEKEFKENIKTTRKAVLIAKNYGANVEAELGYIAKLGESHQKVGFTDPEEARLFIEETGINALAVAIGSAHGFYQGEPKLDFERLSAIRKETNACLVLHGGSGIPDVALREAVKRGICKINLATEIKNMFMQSLSGLLQKNSEIDLRKVFPPAMLAVSDLVNHKLQVVSGKNFL